ncbi:MULTISPECIES: hypothetical protein [unclassified Streptomyces]|uniref:hypothetical protein n=1 Tax=unclassified Streptomyces TaxID=2593676 RepID=UPI0033B44D08
MNFRTAAAAAFLAGAASVSLPGVAYAQDLGCRHFTYQEEAQATAATAGPATPTAQPTRGVRGGLGGAAPQGGGEIAYGLAVCVVGAALVLARVGARLRRRGGRPGR